LRNQVNEIFNPTLQDNYRVQPYDILKQVYRGLIPQKALSIK